MIEIKVTCDSCGAWEDEILRDSSQLHADANDWGGWALTADGEKLCDKCCEAREPIHEEWGRVFSLS